MGFLFHPGLHCLRPFTGRDGAGLLLQLLHLVLTYIVGGRFLGGMVQGDYIEFYILSRHMLLKGFFFGGMV